MRVPGQGFLAGNRKEGAEALLAASGGQTKKITEGAACKHLFPLDLSPTEGYLVLTPDAVIAAFIILAYTGTYCSVCVHSTETGCHRDRDMCFLRMPNWL